MIEDVKSFSKIFKRGIGIPLALILLLSMMVLPIPPILLDLFFTFSITISLLVLLAGIYCARPLDFAVFPTVLLLTTLLRLALNVASTRVVLLHGHISTDAAGKVIEAFGHVVIGGNYTVGIVVFAILVIINFVVVTKGAGRISEVSARFTLDAMPGKQMAIDADLNAGLITQEEAKKRRREISEEADFYGAMDGASKFVRGDAVAGILILFINIMGGIAIGMLQHNMRFSDAIENYALLTIGDGLVAQIPALILSTAAAMMVTRVSSDQDVGHEVFSQLFNNHRPMIIAAIIIIVLGIIPGMPHTAFVGSGAVIGALGYYVYISKHQKSTVAEVSEQESEAEKTKQNQEISWEDVPPVDTISLEIGYRLIPLVDAQQSGELMTRIKGVRKKLSQELGFLVPAIHIRDNIDLNPNAYRVSILGVTVGEDKIYPEKFLAINPGHVFGKIEGIAAKDPAFQLEAYWVDKDQKQNAQTLGYTVVDPSTVIATHISQLIQNQAYQLLGHEEVQKLLDLQGKETPRLIEELTPKPLSLGIIVKVLQNLLRENVPIRDIRTIAEIMAEVGQKSQDPIALTEEVRMGLGGMIVQKINGLEKELPVITLESGLEQLLYKALKNGSNNFLLEPNMAERLQHSFLECAEKQERAGLPIILLVSGAIRYWMARYVKSIVPNMSVLSYQEIPDDRQIKIIAVIGEGR